MQLLPSAGCFRSWLAPLAASALVLLTAQPFRLSGQVTADAVAVTKRLPVFTSAREAVATVTERGPHHRVEQWVERIIGEDGTTNDVTHSATVLANGLHYLDGGEWKETVPEFVAVNGGWLAARGPHQVLVSERLFVAGAVTVVSPEGQTWRSTPMTLALRDRAGGQVWVLGESRDVAGELVAPDTVLFRDAFAGEAGVKADVRVVTSAGGVECDVIVRSGVPSREALGEAGEQAELMVLTEIFEPGGATANPVDRGGRSDDVVRLGALTMDQGKAFGTDLPGPADRFVPVFKRVYQDEPSGRVFLEEATPLDSLTPLLEALPEARVPGTAEARWRNTAGNAVLPIRRTGLLPAPALPRRADGRFEVAAKAAARRTFAAVKSQPGVVLDWSYLNTAANIILRGDTTYYVTNQVALSGTVRVEGGTVIKFAGGGAAGLTLASGTTLDWLAELYRPVFSTAKDDNSIGETISGSSGNPSNYYANPALSVPASVLVTPLAHLRIRHANQGIRVAGTTTQPNFAVLQNVQWVKCNQAVTFDNSPNSLKPAKLQNALVTDTAVLFAACASVHLQADYLTLDSVTSLWTSPSSATLTLSSGVLNNVGGTNGTIFNAPWITNAVSSAVFESSAAGAFYLPLASPIRAVSAKGFVNLTAIAPSGDLSADAPPLLSAISGVSVLVATQTDAPDTIGYHYPRLDCLASNVSVSAPLVLTNRAVVGLVSAKAFQLGAGARIIAGGQPTMPVRFVRVSLVQEGTNGLTGSSFKVFEATTAAPPPTVEARFTEFLLPSDPSGRRVLLNDSANAVFSFSLRDCRVTGGTLTFSPPTPSVSQSVTLFNNVFEGAGLYFYRYYDNDLTVSFRHNLVRYGDCWASYYPQTYQNPYWTFKDNLFESANLLNTAGSYLLGSHNGYTGATATFGGTLLGLKPSDLLNPALGWQTGPDGRFCYPAKTTTAGSLGQLVDAGSQTVTAAGLFHFATQATATREGQENTGQGGANQVNIGFHYPVGTGDADGDTLYDWEEDPDSDGWDTTTPPAATDETNWNDSDSDRYLYNGVWYNGGDDLNDGQERRFGSNPLLYDPDTDGIYDDMEFVEGTDPMSNSGSGKRLREWNFEIAGGGSDDGQALPTAAPTLAPLFDGQAAYFTGVSGSVASYPVASTFALQHGAMRFTYVPEWYLGYATDTPGSECRLFEASEWQFSVTADGRALTLRVPKTGGGSRLAYLGLLPRDDGQNLGHRRGYRIELEWTRGAVWTVINGVRYDTLPGLAEGGGVTVTPSATHLTLGSTAAGALRAKGWIDKLESFNGRLSSSPLWARLHLPEFKQEHHFSAEAVANGLTLTWDRAWQGDPIQVPGNYKVERRELPAGAWELVGNITNHTALDPLVSSGTNGIRAGKYFEYRVHRPGLTPTTTFAAWNGAPINTRGRAILLVDNTVSNAIANELESFKRDLVADGWLVVATNAPRHSDLSYAVPLTAAQKYAYTNGTSSALTTNKANAAVVKSYLQSIYNLDTNATNVVFLIGHVTIPYSGQGSYSHDDNTGAWPADALYGDHTGTWTDALDLGDSPPNIINYNRPNDGRWDQNMLPLEADGSPGRLEMSVGRIDFRLMAPFKASTEIINDNRDDTEIRLLKLYFDKVKRWRRAQIPVQDDFQAWLADGNFYGLVPLTQRLSSHLWGGWQTNVNRFDDDIFLASANYLWSIHGDYGHFTVFGSGQVEPRRHLSSQIANEQTNDNPRGMFQLHYGSYFGEWFHWDSDPLRVILGMTNSVLVSSLLHAGVHLDRLHLGAHYAATLQDAFAYHADNSCRYAALLGDPFVREHPLSPVSSLTLTKASPNVVLSWPAQSAATHGYRIFHASSTNSPNWTWLTDVGAGSTGWTHSSPSNGTHAYLIKSLSLKTTGSGSYTNTSLGTFSSTEVTLP